MDITFETEEGRFNYRVCGIILHDAKVLVMKDRRSPYYYLPGGRVMLGETAEDAILRELREELEIDCRIQRPLWLNQGFFQEDVTGEHFHELCIYFLMDISGADLLTRGESFEGVEVRNGHRFTWLPIDRLQEEYFYPVFLKTEIFSLPEQFTLRTEVE